MFTGIVQAVGSVALRDGHHLRVIFPAQFSGSAIEIGESIAINGSCLTVTQSEPGQATFDVSPETFAKTALGALQPGSRVNLERALRADSLMGGHLVQGHVDGVGRVVGIRPDGEFTVVRFAVPSGHETLMIEKGSIAIDGISLTIVDLGVDEFDVWVVPHTLTHTNLGDRKVGDPVNIEFDITGKYVARWLEKLN